MFRRLDHISIIYFDVDSSTPMIVFFVVSISLSSLASWFCKYKQIAEMDNEDGEGVRRNQVRMKFHASFVFSRFTKQHLARELASWEFTSIRMKIICLKSVLIECLSPLPLSWRSTRLKRERRCALDEIIDQVRCVWQPLTVTSCGLHSISSHFIPLLFPLEWFTRARKDLSFTNRFSSTTSHV